MRSLTVPPQSAEDGSDNSCRNKKSGEKRTVLYMEERPYSFVGTGNYGSIIAEQKASESRDKRNEQKIVEINCAFHNDWINATKVHNFCGFPSS